MHPPPTMRIDAMSQRKDYYEDKEKPWTAGWSRMFLNGPWARDSNFAKTMTSIRQFDSYHPYCCNTCKRGSLQNINLVRCSGCKVMKYCCKDHQKKDWPVHKKWCKAYTKVVGDDTNSSIQNSDEEKVSMNHSKWIQQQQEITMELLRTMGDIRHSDHIQIAALQPHCRRCYRSGRLPGIDLVVCPSCNGVAVCKSCLGDENAADTTWEAFHNGDKEECESHLIYLCCSGMIVQDGDLLVAASDTNCQETFHPRDWIDYFEKKGNDFKGVALPISAPVAGLLTDGLTVPLTINVFLGKLDLLNKSKLCIHILGGDALEAMATSVFHELGRLNPQLKRLDLVVVGPNLPSNYSLSYKNFIAPHQAPCHLDGTIEYVSGLYHYSSVASGSAPNCFVAFNSGIHDQSHFASWQQTLELVKTKKGAPLCITGYTFLEVENDLKTLKRMGFREKIPPTANPFRSMRPFVDPSREETDFIYNNKAYAVVQGK